jgi:hypothetical protein
MTFEAVGAGTSAITVGDLLLLDSSLGNISASLGSSRVEVSATAVSEPAGHALLLAGLAALALARRRPRQSR